MAPLSPRERAALAERRYHHSERLLKLGIQVLLTKDFSQLRKANNIAVTKGGIPLQPLFDPSRTRLGPENGFALIGMIGDRPVATVAGVCRNVVVGMQDALEDLSLLYDPEEIQRAPGAWCTADDDGLNDIRGKIMMMGALWRDPALRQIDGATGVGEHMFALGILQGYELHKPTYAAGIMAAEDVEWLGYDRERFRRFFHGIRYCDPDWPHTNEETRSAIVAMHRSKIRSLFLGLKPLFPHDMLHPGGFSDEYATVSDRA